MELILCSLFILGTSAAGIYQRRGRTRKTLGAVAERTGCCMLVLIEQLVSNHWLPSLIPNHINFFYYYVHVSPKTGFLEATTKFLFNGMTGSYKEN